MKPPNLLLITIDCLRADHVSALGYSRRTTSQFDALSAGSVLFEQAHAGGTPTYYAFPSILASRSPLSWGRDVIGLPNQAETLATVLQNAGYATAAFNAANPCLLKYWGYDRGFETFEDWSDGAPPQTNAAPQADGSASWRHNLNRTAKHLAHITPLTRTLYDEADFWYCNRADSARYRGQWDKAHKYPKGDELTARASAWLDTPRDAPFFMWLHYMDAHAPRYASAESFRGIGASGFDDAEMFRLNNLWFWTSIANRSREQLLRLYDASIYEADRQIGALCELLEQKGLADDTVIVILGDHGEEFFEHGGLGHSPPKLFQELLHVPLLIYAPKNLQAQRVSSPMSVIDLAPTLLEILGVDAPNGFQGTSRVQEITSGVWNENPMIAEGVQRDASLQNVKERIAASILAVRIGNYKMILDWENGTEELFDLANDPHERDPLLLNQYKKIRAELLAAAREHYRTHRTHADSTERLQTRLHAVKEGLGTARVDGT